ncbi:MAG TPA: hypothetical protein VLB68_31800, partial [Pyrinomonadaceae bacterium]|nr:hypothetical protein [Pyrinomonadaceae bacterium]
TTVHYLSPTSTLSAENSIASPPTHSGKAIHRFHRFRRFTNQRLGKEQLLIIEEAGLARLLLKELRRLR